MGLQVEIPPIPHGSSPQDYLTYLRDTFRRIVDALTILDVLTNPEPVAFNKFFLWQNDDLTGAHIDFNVESGDASETLNDTTGSSSAQATVSSGFAQYRLDYVAGGVDATVTLYVDATGTRVSLTPADITKPGLSFYVRDTEQFFDMAESAADVAAPAANHGVLYLKDNGAGKTQLCVRFSSGAVQVLATQP